MRHSYGFAALLLFACGSKETGDEPAANGGSGTLATGGTASSVSATGGTAGGDRSGGSTSAGGHSGAGGSAGAGSVSNAGGSIASGGALDAGAPGASAGSCGSATDADFEQGCLACAASACETCLCSNCTDQLQHCGVTTGCPEIAACIRAAGCAGIDCYCGTFDAISCAAGQSDGPCKATILAAPGSRMPSVLNPSAGPASDAAAAISGCMQPGQACATACPSGG